MKRALLLITLMSVRTLAQEVGLPEETDEAPKGRRAWIIATSIPDEVRNPVKVLTNGEITEINLFKRAAGKSIKVPADGQIHLVNPITDQEGKPSYERYASVVVPEDIRQSLVILFPVPGLTPPLKFKGKVVDLDRFRGGSAMFINLTPMEVGVALDTNKEVISPGNMEIIRNGNFTGTKNVTLGYFYRKPGQNDWQPISASTAAFQSQRREILIFSYDNELDQIDYHGLSFEPIP